ncbi:MAG: hypothetical protein ACI8RD_012073, partial [Bacillariaceae sp.]
CRLCLYALCYHYHGSWFMVTFLQFFHTTKQNPFKGQTSFEWEKKKYQKIVLLVVLSLGPVILVVQYNYYNRISFYTTLYGIIYYHKFGIPYNKIYSILISLKN